MMMQSFPLRITFRTQKHFTCTNGTTDFCYENRPAWIYISVHEVHGIALHHAGPSDALSLKSQRNSSPPATIALVNQLPGASLYDSRLCSSSVVRLHSHKAFDFI